MTSKPKRNPNPPTLGNVSGERHYYQHEIRPLPTLTKYFKDGLIETWLTNDQGEEVYLIRSYQHPSGLSPVFEMLPMHQDFDHTERHYRTDKSSGEAKLPMPKSGEGKEK